MSALQKLQAKIEQWRMEHEALKGENTHLKAALSTASISQHEQQQQIEVLKKELEEKDTEIEKIITQVESLLS